MSLSSAVSPGLHVDEALKLAPLQQEIYLSLLGAEAWRLARTRGMHRPLLLEMFAKDKPALDFVAGIYDVLAKCSVSVRFHDLDVLAKLINREVELLPKQDRSSFRRWEKSISKIFLADLFKVKPDDPGLLPVGKVPMFMFHILFHEEHQYTQLFMSTLARMWFMMCDEALTVEADVTPLYAEALARVRISLRNEIY